MPGHFTPPEANLYYTMVFILPAEILFSVLTYVGIGTLTSYLKLLMFQPPQLRQHSHLPTRPTPNSNGNINTIATAAKKTPTSLLVQHLFRQFWANIPFLYQNQADVTSLTNHVPIILNVYEHFVFFYIF